jgi:hypothetical protein
MAISASTPLLHRDRDFYLIAGVEPKLMLVPALSNLDRKI